MNRRNFLSVLSVSVGGIILGIPKGVMARRHDVLARANRRRLLDYIKRTISGVLESHVGDPNDDITRQDVANNVRKFLDHVKSKSRDIERFRVVCDRGNNPPDLVDMGQLRVTVWIQHNSEVGTRLDWYQEQECKEKRIS